MRQLKHKYITYSVILLITLLVGVAVFTLQTNPVLANQEEIDRLEDQIAEQRNRIADLDKQIEQERQKVAATAAEAATIANKVAEIEATKRKIESGIAQTESQITKSQLTIEKLELEIDDKEAKIALHSEVLAQSLRNVNKLESTSLIETILGYDDMSEFWQEIATLRTFQKEIQATKRTLEGLNTELRHKQEDEVEEKEALENSKKVLAGEREVVAATKAEQDELLAITKDKEATYRSILNQKIAQRSAFEAAMLEFESQLQTLIDPASFPDARRGVLGWPLASIRITQQFGGSQFAKNNPHIYGRGFHNGTDFGVPVGEKVLSVESGTIQATGNTDAYPGCYSWGKWVLVKHNNGLTSLYAHLSSILVSPGETVERGEVIALSGNTGVSTGPHLHLTLYASQGVEVVKFNEFKPGATGCAATGAATPVAPLEAYLDPMQYLPAL